MVHASTSLRELVTRSVHSAELHLLLSRILHLLTECIVRFTLPLSKVDTDFIASYSETKLQLCRYLSDRTGILAIANVPIIWLFATRNDPLLWLTGWSFATYNRFHRWVARVATLQAIAHSIGYSVYSYYVGGGDYAAEWKYRYWYTGQIVSIEEAVLSVSKTLIRLRRRSSCLCLWCLRCMLSAETTTTSSWFCILSLR